MCCIVREDETPSFVIPNTALVFHLQKHILILFLFQVATRSYLDVIRVYLLPWKNIECAVIISPQKNAAATVMPEKNQIVIVIFQHLDIILDRNISTHFLCASQFCVGCKMYYHLFIICDVTITYGLSIKSDPYFWGFCFG